MSRNLIINADDFGLTAGICRAISTLFDEEALSHTTIMIAIPGAAALCKTYRSQLQGRAGTHLQITAEGPLGTPISAPEEIPSLVTKDGLFKHVQEVTAPKPEEVALEWERQILTTADALGTMPTHIDTHHGMHRREELTPVFLELAAKYRLPGRGGREIGAIDGTPYHVETSDLCLSSWTGKNKTKDELLSLINSSYEKLQEGQVLEIVTHPGLCDEELIRISSWNQVRENDYHVLRTCAREGVFKKNNIALVSFSTLAHRREI